MSPHKKQANLATAYELFCLGWGTDRISEYFGISEAAALRRANIERSNMLRRENPYEVAQ